MARGSFDVAVVTARNGNFDGSKIMVRTLSMHPSPLPLPPPVRLGMVTYTGVQAPSSRQTHHNEARQ